MSTSDDLLLRRLDLTDDHPHVKGIRARSFALLLPFLRPDPSTDASGDPSGDASRPRRSRSSPPKPWNPAIPPAGRSERAVVDVGCGAGRAVAELAGLGVRAVGIDLSERMITIARRRYAARAEFLVGDALALPFAAGEVAGYRADKILHDLAEPAAAVAEARLVLAPGGRAVLLGQDWDTLTIDSDRPSLTRTIVHARADMVASPRAARAQRSLLLGCGFRDVTVEVHTTVFTGDAGLPLLSGTVQACRTAGAVTDAEAGAWLDEQRERARDGRLFVAVPIFMAAGVRP